MTAAQISRASTATLQVRRQMLDATIFATDEDQDRAQWESDLIGEELAGRAHDLQDPSSGLGCHQPT